LLVVFPSDFRGRAKHHCRNGRQIRIAHTGGKQQRFAHRQI